jgi:hypothetical protein
LKNDMGGWTQFKIIRLYRQKLGECQSIYFMHASRCH